jgi:hypothetical protein
MSMPELQPGGRLDLALRGPGYPEPVSPVALLRNDRFAEARRWADEMRFSLSNVRHGWMRTDA